MGESGPRAKISAWLWRLRFTLGRASFLQARVLSPESVPTDFKDRSGRRLGQRMLSHYAVSTGQLNTGRQGFERFMANRGGEGVTAALTCGPCGHAYIVRVAHPADPLSHPASYVSDWFRFWRPEYPGDSLLLCPRCESKGRPTVRLLE